MSNSVLQPGQFNGSINSDQKPKGNKIKKILNSVKTYFSNPSNIIIIIFAIFLAVMVVYPLIQLVLSTFTIQATKEGRAIADAYDVARSSLKKGAHTVLVWPYVLFNPIKVKGIGSLSINLFWKPMGKSVLMAMIACTISILIGGALAFLITRTNIPFKKFLSTVFVFPYIMPSWSMAMFWDNFFKNTGYEAGGARGLLQSITGLCAPEWLVFGFWPSAFVLGIHYAPFAYILIGGILRNMDANLEEAAIILKASRFKILRRITIPIVAPALVSTILLVFSSSISSYTVPQFLNGNGSFQSISILIRSNLMSPESQGQGYVIATILMFLSILILTINNWFTKSRRSFTTVSGKSGQINKIDLGKVGKWIIVSFVTIFVIFFAIVPLITFILESLEETSGDISSITLKYWFSKTNAIEDAFVDARDFQVTGIFHNSTILNSFGRSIILAVLVSLFCGTCGILIGYAVSKKRRSRLANLVSSLAFLPYLIPALSFSAVFLAVSKTDTFKFLDVSRTMTEVSAIAICLMVGGVKFLPFASRSGTNAMLQLSGEIEEAAVIVGCPWIKRMTRVIFPIQKSSFISGYLLPFISCMREYTLFALISSSTSFIVNTLEYYSRNSLDHFANGINLMIVLFVIIVNLLINWLTGASIDKGIGG